MNNKKIVLNSKSRIFETARPQLIGIAYRLLGSMSEAQDAVQDTYVKWILHKDSVDIPIAWLSRVCTNRCLDQLKSAYHKRIDYVGQWLPEPIQIEFENTIEEQIEMASSLTTAFLLLLERLTPKERAAYILHDIFSMSFDEVAAILDLKPINCRKLATRARNHVVNNKVRYIPTEQRQKELLQAFQEAIQTGNVENLSTILRTDSALRADSGGKVRAVLEVIQGKETICTFISSVLSEPWSNLRITQQIINGTLGLFIQDNDRPYAAITFGYDTDGQISQIYIIRHPDKLEYFTQSRWIATAAGQLIINQGGILDN